MDKVPSFDTGEAPRRSTFALDMTLIQVRLVMAAATLFCASPVCAVEPAAAVARASLVRPAVRWDKSSFVQVNLAGTNDAFGALVGYSQGGFVIALIREGETLAPFFLEFGIGQSQDSLCAAPVRLSTEKLSCGSQVPGDLPGCRVGPRSQQLVLTDGDCDPIVVYWDDRNHGPSWWRN